MLLPATTLRSAQVVAQRLRAYIAATPLELGEGRFHPLTVSIGCAEAPEVDPPQVIDRADRALYVAKRTRNTVASFALETSPTPRSVAHALLRAMRRVLASAGTLVLVGASKGNWVAPIARILAASQLSRFGNQKLTGMLTDMKREDLVFVKDLIEAGKVTPVIDRTYPLSEVPDALRYLETMRARGKVVITV